MKRNCLFALFALFASVHIFATDIRQVMFGNNYETINEIDADSFLDEHPDIKKYVSQIKLGDFMIRGHDKEYFRCFEQIIGDKRFVRVVKAVNPLSDEYILNWRNPDKISSCTHHAYITQMFYLPESQTAVAILPFCKMDADGYAWENGTDNKYEMIEIIQRNGNVKGFLLTRLVDNIDHRNRPEENGIYVEKYINTAEYYLFDDVMKNATESFGTIRYARKYSTIRYVSIEASQPLVDSKRPFMYTVNNAFDGNAGTAYVENTINDYVGFEFSFSNEISIKNIEIINGYARSEKLYYENNQVKEIDVFNLYKKIDLLENNILEQSLLKQKIRLKEELKTEYIFFCSGNELYKGNKYSDTCIAEFDFYTLNIGYIFGD